MSKKQIKNYIILFEDVYLIKAEDDEDFIQLIEEDVGKLKHLKHNETFYSEYFGEKITIKVLDIRDEKMIKALEKEVNKGKRDLIASALEIK